MKISVITTTYNRKDFLLEAMESVQKSVLIPLGASFEHIIYDDASTDGTEKLFEHSKFNNVSYIRGEKNCGQSFGKNRAIEQAKGDYIFFLDSDDVLLGRTLYHFAKMAETHPETAWITSDFIHSDKNLAYRIGEDYYGWDFKSPKEMLEAIFRGEHFIQGNVFFKKEVFLALGGFDEDMRMAEDLDLFIRFLIKGNMPKYSPHISHIHRVHGNNLSIAETRERHMAHLLDLKRKYESELKVLGIKV